MAASPCFDSIILHSSTLIDGCTEGFLYTRISQTKNKAKPRPPTKHVKYVKFYEPIDDYERQTTMNLMTDSTGVPKI